VPLRGDAGAAGGIDGNGLLWVECLEEQRVGYDTDIGAEPDQFDFVIVRKERGQICRTEGRLLNDLRPAHKRLERICNLPAGRAADAVLNGQFLPLLRLEIVRTVGVHGKDEHRARRLLCRELCHHTRQHLLRLSRPERAINEIILHIHDNKCLAHNKPSLSRLIRTHFAQYSTQMPVLVRFFAKSSRLA